MTAEQEQQFEFPSTVFLNNCQTITNIVNLNKLIQELWDSNRYLYADLYPLVVKRESDRKYCFVCRFRCCQFFIRFQYTEEGFFQMESFQNKHVHPCIKSGINKNSFFYAPRKKRKEIWKPYQENWENLPENMKLMKAMEKMKENAEQLKSVMQVSYDSETKQGVGLFFYSSLMMGERLKNDHRAICLQQIHPKSEQSRFSPLPLYLLYNITKDRKISIFAFALVKDKKKLVQECFKLETLSQCETFLCDDDSQIHQSLKRIKEQQKLGFQIVLRISVDIFQQQNKVARAFLLREIRKLLRSVNEYQFGQVLQGIFKFPKLTERAYNTLCDLIKKRDIYGIAFRENKTFIGFNLYCNAHVKVSEQLKKYCDYYRMQDKIYQLIPKLIIAFNQIQQITLNQIGTQATEKQFKNLPFFNVAQQLMTQSSLKVLGNEIVNSFQCNSLSYFSQSNTHKFFITSKEGSFMVTKEMDKWSCSCSFEKIMSIPCRHILKAIVSMEYSFYPHINQYWKSKQNQLFTF